VCLLITEARGQGGYLISLRAEREVLFAILLPRASGQSWDGALGAPTVADIDGDPDLEVVPGMAHPRLVAYELPGTANARVLWGTGRGNYLRRESVVP
jgi:hypothetical protein